MDDSKWTSVRVQKSTLTSIRKIVANSNGKYESVADFVDEHMQQTLVKGK